MSSQFNLVARFAANTFWLGRYLERAENVARILQINETYARDNPEGPDWRRVLDLYADTERFFETLETADAPSVLNFYVLDRDNPSAIAAAVSGARENARSVRHLISTEMWMHLNIFHGQVLTMTQRDIRLTNVANVTASVISNCQMFEGVAEGTFLRGEPWCFYQLGKYIERADQTTRILDIGYDRISSGEGDALTSVQWNVLLRSVSGYHAYRSRHPAGSSLEDIERFLLYDTEFPRSVKVCVRRMTERLRELELRHGANRHSPIERARRSLEFALDTGPGKDFTPARLDRFLDRIQILLGDVSDAVGDTYFDYTQPEPQTLGTAGQDQ